MRKEDLIRQLKRQEFPEHILESFENVSREDFVPKESQEHTYKDIPLPIGHGQTISQPYTIAMMLMFLEIPKSKENQRILEIGSGSGYVLALLNELNPEGIVYGVERIKGLADKSKEVLNKDEINIKELAAARGIQAAVKNRGYHLDRDFNKVIDRQKINRLCDKEVKVIDRIEKKEKYNQVKEKIDAREYLNQDKLRKDLKAAGIDVFA